MGQAGAAAESLIGASPADVYAVIADYTTHHPRIMPPSNFSDLEVEQGGIGAGTVFHITLRVLGTRQRLHMRVAEPEPGRVLTETNIDTGGVTAFTVDAAANGDTIARTRIASEWTTGAGIRGWFDRSVAPILTRRMLGKQLRELDRYMHRGRASS